MSTGNSSLVTDSLQYLWINPQKNCKRPQGTAKGQAFSPFAQRTLSKQLDAPTGGRGALSSLPSAELSLSHLQFNCSGLGLAFGRALCSRPSTAIKHLDCAPSSLGSSSPLQEPPGYRLYASHANSKVRSSTTLAPLDYRAGAINATCLTGQRTVCANPASQFREALRQMTKPRQLRPQARTPAPGRRTIAPRRGRSSATQGDDPGRSQ